MKFLPELQAEEYSRLGRVVYVTDIKVDLMIYKQGGTAAFAPLVLPVFCFFKILIGWYHGNYRPSSSRDDFFCKSFLICRPA